MNLRYLSFDDGPLVCYGLDKTPVYSPFLLGPGI